MSRVTISRNAPYWARLAALMPLSPPTALCYRRPRRVRPLPREARLRPGDGSRPARTVSCIRPDRVLADQALHLVAADGGNVVSDAVEDAGDVGELEEHRGVEGARGDGGDAPDHSLRFEEAEGRRLGDGGGEGEGAPPRERGRPAAPLHHNAVRFSLRA